MRGNAEITFTGNLTADPDLRFTPSGVAVAGFSVAVTPRVQDPAGGWKDGEPTFYRVSAWRALAENIAASLHKGNRVQVVGTIASRTFTDKEGNDRIGWDVTAEEVGVSLQFAVCDIKRAERAAAAPEPAAV